MSLCFLLYWHDQQVMGNMLMFVSGSGCLRRDVRANCHQHQDPLLLSSNVIMQCDFKDKQEPDLSQHVTETVN